MPAARAPFLAACVQMRVTVDKQRNAATAARLIAVAAARGARLIVLPELFSWRGPAECDASVAEPLDGETLSGVAALARAHGATIVAGSFLERSRDGGLPANTSVVFGPDGARLAVYRKVHLFDVSIPGAAEVRESARFAPGAEPVVVTTEVGKIGLSICYDLRFPQLYRRLVRAGAEILCVPSAFTFATGAAHWEVLLRARAIENLCYVLAPNQSGPTEHGPQVYGHTSIIDPWGTVLARASEGEGVVVAEIDPARVTTLRQQLPCLEHARLG